jgi:hypothetical protein
MIQKIVLFTLNCFDYSCQKKKIVFLKIILEKNYKYIIPFKKSLYIFIKEKSC